MLDGSSWVKNSAVIRSAGSTQNAVLAAPPQAYSPLVESTLFFAGIVDDREAEAEADAVEGRLREERAAELLEVDAARKVVARHVANGAAAEQSDPVELALAEQHLGEPVVVGGARHETAAARQRGRRTQREVAHRVEPGRPPGAGIGRVQRGEPVDRSGSATEKAVSGMPSGSKMRVRKNSSSDWPDATSTTRPSTSVATE